MNISISGTGPIISTSLHPPLDLVGNYECALLHFCTHNFIPNLNQQNSKFYCGNNYEFTVPTGVYDLSDLEQCLINTVKDSELISKDFVLSIEGDSNTSKCLLYCSEDIDFDHSDTFNSLLGFEKKIYEANKYHESENNVTIQACTIIRVECDIISQSYLNGKVSHSIYEFPLNVPPGFKIIEIPSKVVYLPVKNNLVNSITIRLTDENGKLIDFGKENIYLRLHIRKKKYD